MALPPARRSKAPGRKGHASAGSSIPIRMDCWSNRSSSRACVQRESGGHERRALRVEIGRLQDFADTVKRGLHNADWTTRREIIRAVVKQIQIDEDDVSSPTPPSYRPSPRSPQVEAEHVQHVIQR